MNEELQEKFLKRIKERGRIKSKKLYNAFHRVDGDRISDRTKARALRRLEESGKIEREGHGEKTVCIFKEETPQNA